MATSPDLEMKGQIGFDMSKIVDDFSHGLNKDNVETKR